MLGSRDHIVLGVVDGCLERERHILERTDEIEIRECPESARLSHSDTEVGRSVVRVFLSHIRRIMDDGVAAVDDGVDACPVTLTVGFLEVTFEDVAKVCTDVFSHVGVVGANLAPHDDFMQIVRLHAHVARPEHVVHVALVLPEVLEHNVVQRQEVEVA